MAADSAAPEHPILADLERRISNALDIFYEKIGKHHHAVSGRIARGFEPPADIAESEGGLRVALELPGLEAEDIEISASEGAITVRGRKQVEHETEGDTFLCRERLYGAFQRTISVADDLDADKASAAFKNGVLTITVPLKPGAERKARKIAIKSA